MILFENTDIAETSDTSKKVRLVVDGLETADIWLTDVTGQVTPNYQLLYSLGKGAFVNAFNNRLGQFSITGIYIPDSCIDFGGGTPPFIDFYKKVQITQKKPAKISYDGISIQGWATQMNLKSYSQNNIDGHEFTIQFLGRIRELEE